MSRKVFVFGPFTRSHVRVRKSACFRSAGHQIASSWQVPGSRALGTASASGEVVRRLELHVPSECLRVITSRRLGERREIARWARPPLLARLSGGLNSMSRRTVYPARLSRPGQARREARRTRRCSGLATLAAELNRWAQRATPRLFTSRVYGANGQRGANPAVAFGTHLVPGGGFTRRAFVAFHGARLLLLPRGSPRPRRVFSALFGSQHTVNRLERFRPGFGVGWSGHSKHGAMSHSHAFVAGRGRQ